MRCLSVVLIACALPVQALEVVRRDVAMALEALPTDFDFELSGPAGTTSGSDAFDRVLGLRLGGRWAWSRPGADGALQLGLDLRLSDADYGGEGTYRTIGGGISAGYAQILSRSWTLYGEAVGEFGMATLDLDANAERSAVTADGSHHLYGVRIGALYAISRAWLITGDLGYAMIGSDTADGDRDFTVDQEGLVIGLGLVWRFSDAPARLE